MRAKNLALGALCAAVVLSAVDSLSYAATGQAVIVGSSNRADATTSLTKTSAGSSLTLRSSPGVASLAVSGSVRVKHLNADRVDGYEGSRLLNDSYRLSYRSSSDVFSMLSLDIPTPGPGSYQVVYTIVAKPMASPTLAAPFQIVCALTDSSDEDAIAGGSSATVSTVNPALSGHDAVVLTTARPLGLTCASDGNQFFTIANLRISFTRTTVLKDVALAPAS